MTPQNPVQQAVAVFRKDLRMELRNRGSLNAILLFSVISLIVMAFGVGNLEIIAHLKAGLLWVVLFFAAFSGLSHVFVQEEETGTSLALKMHARPESVYAGKAAFNLVLTFGIAVIVVPIFVIMLKLPTEKPIALAAVIISGLFALSSGASAVAAIISQSRGKGAIFGAIGFPILLPALMVGVRATQIAVTSSDESVVRTVFGLVAFGVMITTVAAALFPILWDD
ncbi:MAG: heme exporter protein CcmB [Chthonomonadales bacterium]